MGEYVCGLRLAERREFWSPGRRDSRERRTGHDSESGGQGFSHPVADVPVLSVELDPNQMDLLP